MPVGRHLERRVAGVARPRRRALEHAAHSLPRWYRSVAKPTMHDGLCTNPRALHGDCGATSTRPDARDDLLRCSIRHEHEGQATAVARVVVPHANLIRSVARDGRRQAGQTRLSRPCGRCFVLVEHTPHTLQADLPEAVAMDLHHRSAEDRACCRLEPIRPEDDVGVADRITRLLLQIQADLDRHDSGVVRRADAAYLTLRHERGGNDRHVEAATCVLEERRPLVEVAARNDDASAAICRPSLRGEHHNAGHALVFEGQPVVKVVLVVRRKRDAAVPRHMRR